MQEEGCAVPLSESKDTGTAGVMKLCNQQAVTDFCFLAMSGGRESF
jgi:hypothetical protein